MRTKTVALTAAGALALSALGGVAFAGPLLADKAPNATASASADDATDEAADDADDPTEATDDETSTGEETDTEDETDADDETSTGEETSTEHTAERAAAIADELTDLVEDGTLTQEQADEVATTLAESMPGNGKGALMGHGRNGHGPGASQGQGSHGAKGGWQVIEETLQTAASTLGLSQDALGTELRAGRTLGEIADTAGVDRAILVDDLVQTLTAETAERVADGTLTQEMADAIAAELDQRVTEALDRQLPGGHGGPKGADDEDDS